MGTSAAITVDQELADFVQKQVGDGRYGSVSEVVDEARIKAVAKSSSSASCTGA